LTYTVSWKRRDFKTTFDMCPGRINFDVTTGGEKLTLFPGVYYNTTDHRFYINNISDFCFKTLIFVILQCTWASAAGEGGGRGAVALLDFHTWYK